LHRRFLSYFLFLLPRWKLARRRQSYKGKA